jgi:hypothetical protein
VEKKLANQDAIDENSLVPVVAAMRLRRPGAVGRDCVRATKKKLEPSQANLLRGEYGRYRANSDLLYYHLGIRVEPEKRRGREQENGARWYLSGGTR